MYRIFCVFFLFIEIQPLYCLEAKCVGNWKSEAHWWALIQWEKPDFILVGPAYWIWDPLRTLVSRNTLPSTNRSVPNILAQLSPEKQWVGGGGVAACITLAPHYQYRLGINRTVWGFRLNLGFKTIAPKILAHTKIHKDILKIYTNICSNKIKQNSLQKITKI